MDKKCLLVSMASQWNVALWIFISTGNHVVFQDPVRATIAISASFVPEKRTQTSSIVQLINCRVEALEENQPHGIMVL